MDNNCNYSNLSCVSQSNPGESLKLKITNHGSTSKVVSNHVSSSNHNHHHSEKSSSSSSKPHKSDHVHKSKDSHKKSSHDSSHHSSKIKTESHKKETSSKHLASGDPVKMKDSSDKPKINHEKNHKTSSSSKPKDISSSKEHKGGHGDQKPSSDPTKHKIKEEKTSSGGTKIKDGHEKSKDHSNKNSNNISKLKDNAALKDHIKKEKHGSENNKQHTHVKSSSPIKDGQKLSSSNHKSHDNKNVVKVKTDGDKVKEKHPEKKHKDKENKDSIKDKHKSVNSEHKHKSNHEGVKEHKEHKDHKDSSKEKVLNQKPKEKSHSSDKEKKEKHNEKFSSPTIKVEPKVQSSPEKKSPVKAKIELDSDDDVPLSSRKTPDDDDDMPLAARKTSKADGKSSKRMIVDSDDDDQPLSSRVDKVKKVKKEVVKKRKADYSDDEDDDDDDDDDDNYKPEPKKVKRTTASKATAKTTSKKAAPKKAAPETSPKKKKKEEETQEVWKWWEEEKLDNNVKWKTLQHKGPVFAPDYEPLPKDVKFYYDKKPMVLSPETEEVATFYSKMLDHDYTSKEAFNKNFFKDWRKCMNNQERELIVDLKKCNFTEMQKYFVKKSEERKNRTKEEKLQEKKKNEELLKEYGFCIIDGHKEKIGNFKIEPPGLFRGRGEHPKMGKFKKRIRPEDIIINCSKNSEIPKPPGGRKWKEVRHDNTVTWLVCWTENVQGQQKYIMLNPSSKLKGEKDWQKYETARKLKTCVNKIRENYKQDWKSKEMKIRQRAVALYFIDKLALRAGNEKEEGETADTVGCCSLRVEHITLDEEKDGKEFVVSFDFLGKDSIRYTNSVSVEKRVFKNLQLFMENKKDGDDVFDRLNTSILNKHLNELMEGLTAKVFRTFNASKTLQEQLNILTKPDDPLAAKLLSYNRANRAVAILCNHQRSVPKTFDKSMENLQNKIKEKEQVVRKAEKEFNSAKKDYKNGRGGSAVYEKKKKAFERLKEQLEKLELQATDKEENKQIALGTSKLNYLDPRISVAWCKKWDVPIEKVFNRTQRDKFRWAIEMAGPEFVF